MKKIVVILMWVTAMLVGCGSFNNSFNQYPAAVTITEELRLLPTVASEPIPVVEVVKKTEMVKVPNVCPSFQLPVMPKTPDLPFPDPRVTEKMSLTEIERAERDHIDQLRSFIIDYRTALRKAYLQYSITCGEAPKP